MLAMRSTVGRLKRLYKGTNSKVQELVLERRVKAGQIGFRSLNITSVFLVAIKAVELMDYFASGYGMQRKIIKKMLYESELFPMLPIAFIAFIVMQRPHLMTSRSLNCMNCITSVLIIMKMLIISEHKLNAKQSWLMLVRLIQGFICGDAFLSSCLQAVVGSCFIAVSGHIKQHLGAGEYMPYLFRELGFLLFFIFFMWVIELSRYSEAEALHEAKHTKTNHSMVLRLLSTMCDAVVHLDPSLCISEPSRTLAGLLLIHDPVNALKSRPFLDFIVDLPLLTTTCLFFENYCPDF